jgi:hypothetical protein
MNIPYFKNFKTVNYDIDGEGNNILLTDFTPCVTIKNADEYTNYLFYNIKDGERPDVVSSTVYGTPKYHWTIYVINNHLRNGSVNWPYSYSAFTSMIEHEYDQYSAISFKPTPTQSAQGSFSYLNLSDEYLEILYIQPNGNTTQRAKIVKYDFQRCQCIIQRNSITGTSADTFVNYSSYNIGASAAPVIEDPGAAPVVSNTYSSKEIYKEWEVQRAEYVKYLQRVEKVNEWNAITKTAYYNDINDPIDVTYDSVGPNFSWAMYSNAAYQYYIKDTQTDKVETASAYDAVTNGTTTYISYYEKEEIENERLQKIKIIKPEYIERFVKEYFKEIKSVRS